ncbi:MAG: hypothetical protein ABI183_02385 [Polyangiaceae bacterium]
MREGVLLLDQQTILAQKNISGIYPAKDRAGAILIGERGWRRFRATTVVLDSREAAEAFTAELRWDPGHAAADYIVYVGQSGRVLREMALRGVLLAAAMTAAVVIGIFAFHLSAGVMTPLVSCLAVLTVFLVNRRRWTRLRVGTDGILIRLGGGRRKRFVSYDDIRFATHDLGGARLHLLSGEELAFSSPEPVGLEQLATISISSALVERIEKARALHASLREARSQLADMLQRGDRSIEEWRRAAATISHEQYRVAATPRELLEDIVRNAAMKPDVRIGAALALRGENAPRVRVEENTSAVPELNAAIEAAFDGDDTALARAISKMKIA